MRGVRHGRRRRLQAMASFRGRRPAISIIRSRFGPCRPGVRLRRVDAAKREASCEGGDVRPTGWLVS